MCKHINKLTNIGSDNGLPPNQCQAIIWTSDGMWLIGNLGMEFSEIMLQKCIWKCHLRNGDSFVSTSMCQHDKGQLQDH